MEPSVHSSECGGITPSHILTYSVIHFVAPLGLVASSRSYVFELKDLKWCWQFDVSGHCRALLMNLARMVCHFPPLFQLALSRRLHILDYYIVSNLTFLLAVLKEAAGRFYSMYWSSYYIFAYYTVFKEFAGNIFRRPADISHV
jgi:hypothetical protein